MKNHTTAHTADDLLIKYVYIILLFQRKNEYSYTVGVDALIDPSNADETTTVNETATVDESVSLTTVDPQIAQIAHLNPILYRSYYYDKETEWYYLNTRYYSPDMCRFINADGYIQTGQSLLDKNMFAYCGNNPINNIDTNGNRHSSVAKTARNLHIKAIRASVRYRLSKNLNVYICKEGEELNAPPGSVVVIDRRKKGPKKDNNFEILGSWQISDKELQTAICQSIIDYNKENPDDTGWNRDIDTMLVEWDWHNWGYDNNIAPTHTDNVNFDMGLGTNSTKKPVQIIGYGIEYAKSKTKNFLNKTYEFFKGGL